MSDYEIIPIGGYNLEYRQNHSTSDGYIYSKAGADATTFAATIDPYLPSTVSFAGASQQAKGRPDPYAFSKGTLASSPDFGACSIIFPFPQETPPGLPKTLALDAAGVAVTLTLIARQIDKTQMESEHSESDLVWFSATIARHTRLTLFGDSVLQVIISPSGDRYGLVSVFGEPPARYQVDKLHGLATLPLPKGYTYHSEPISEDFTFYANKVAYIVANEYFNFQRYTVGPEERAEVGDILEG
jgi:hypothetical protein